MQDYNAWTERYNAFMLATEGGTFWACLDCYPDLLYYS